MYWILNCLKPQSNILKIRKIAYYLLLSYKNDLRMTYKRILLKLSGEALMGKKPYGIDPAIVQSIAEDVSKVISNNVQIAIVVGGQARGPLHDEMLRGHCTSKKFGALRL